MIDPINLLTIVLMALATYLTRIGGYVLLRNRSLSTRAMAVMEAAPSCVLISLIAPFFVSDNPADIIALVITLVASIRLSMLPTVMIGIASSCLLRHLLA